MLERFDNTLFVTQPYRAVFNKSQIKSEVSKLQETYGDKVCFIRRNKQDIEVIVSRVEGALLGENIAKHFVGQEEFVYFEQIAKDRYIIVVVIDNEIHSDAMIDWSQVSFELSPWLQGKKQFKLFYFGEDIEKIVANINPTFVKSDHFICLEDSVFNNLVVDDGLQTKPIKEALKKAKLSNQNLFITMCVLLLLFIVFLAYLFWPATPKIKIKKPVNNYAVYYQQLKSPSPASIVSKVGGEISQLQTLAGWKPLRLHFNAYQMRSVIQPTTIVSFEKLSTWAQKKNAILSFQGNLVTLSFPLHLLLRHHTKKIAKLQKKLYQLIDRIKQDLPNVKITTGVTQRRPYYSTEILNLNLQGLSAQYLQDFSKIFQGYPLVLEQGGFVIKHGLLFGDIKLKMLGKH